MQDRESVASTSTPARGEMASQTGHESSEDVETDLQPKGVLNRSAMKGRFSIRNLLVDGDSDDQQESREETHDGSRKDDPIHMGLVTLSLAKSLFDR
jgi:hypothetical protein